MKRGFTLVEMIGVVVILSMLMLISGVAITNMVKKSKAELSQAQLDSLKMAAQLWVEENLDEIDVPGCTIFSLEELENKKIINEVDRKNNPNIDDYIVKVCVSSNANISSELVDYSQYYSCFGTSENENEELTITSYCDNINNDPTEEACPTDVYIPGKIDGKKVVAIGEEALRNKYNNPITSVIISDGIEEIGAGAFGGNEIKKAILPDTLTTIGERAFSNNKIKSLEIQLSGQGIIDCEAFSYNNIVNITIGSGVKTIGRVAFGYNSIKRLDLNNATELETIGDNAFSRNKLTSVIIPDSVKTIGMYAFNYNNLSTVEIGSGIESIGQSAFYNNSNSEYGPNALTSFKINRAKDESILGYTVLYWKTNPHISYDRIEWLDS